MFVSPCVITMIISATRMHRCLIDFAFRSADMYETLLFISFCPLTAAHVISGHMEITD